MRKLIFIYQIYLWFSFNIKLGLNNLNIVIDLTTSLLSYSKYTFLFLNPDGSRSKLKAIQCNQSFELTSQKLQINSFESENVAYIY